MNILTGEIGSPRSFNFVEVLTIERAIFIHASCLAFRSREPCRVLNFFPTSPSSRRRASSFEGAVVKYHRVSLGGEGEGGYAGRVLICAGDVMAGSEHPVHGISAARDQDPPTCRLLLPFFFLFPGTLSRIISSSSSSSSFSSGSQCSDRFRRFVRHLPLFFFLL